MYIMNTNVQTGSGLLDIVTDAANKIKDETKKQSGSMFNLFSKESQPANNEQPNMPEVQEPNMPEENIMPEVQEPENKYVGGIKRRKSKSKKHKKHKKSLKKIVKRRRKNTKNTKHKKHKKTVRKTSKRKY